MKRASRGQIKIMGVNVVLVRQIGSQCGGCGRINVEVSHGSSDLRTSLFAESLTMSKLQSDVYDGDMIDIRLVMFYLYVRVHL